MQEGWKHEGMEEAGGLWFRALAAQVALDLAFWSGLS